MGRLESKPRSKEPRRRDLERKFLADTIAKTKQVSKQTARRIGRLFARPNGKDFKNDQARMEDDFVRRRALRELMDIRVRTRVEPWRATMVLHGATMQVRSIWVNCADEDRPTIIKELEKRVVKKEPGRNPFLFASIGIFVDGSSC